MFWERRFQLRFKNLLLTSLVIAAAWAGPGYAAPQEATPPAAGAEKPSPAESITRALGDPKLRLLVEDVLARNPDLASLAAAARAAAQRAPQVKALPDPVLSFTAFLQTPETRVGPQYAISTLSQRFPWFGKLPARERAALAEAAAAGARVEARKLALVTEVRRLAYELAFLDSDEREVRADRQTLAHYEELAQARYASGVGIAQGVVKIQAEITRDDDRLLAIATRRATLTARLNALRDRPKGTPVPRFELPSLVEKIAAVDRLRTVALDNRPELAEADALIAAAEHLTQVRKIDYKPDVTLGVSYALVGKRSDRAGEINPPENNGKDVLGLFGAINLPVRREKLAAGVEEAIQKRLAAEQKKRSIIAAIDGDLADLTDRLELIGKRVHLFDDVLTPQAAESLRSAEEAYAAGTLNALDLLDAERVLLQVRIATDRARTDFAIAEARLEGTIGAPLAVTNEVENAK